MGKLFQRVFDDVLDSLGGDGHFDGIGRKVFLLPDLEVACFGISSRLDEETLFGGDGLGGNMFGGSWILGECTAGDGHPAFSLRPTEVWTEFGGSDMLGGVIIAAEVFYERNGVGEFSFSAVRFPGGNQFPFFGVVVEEVTVQLFELVIDRFVDDEELHFFSNFPGISQEALAPGTFTSETGNFRVFVMADALNFFFFGNVVGVVTMGDGIPDGKDQYFPFGGDVLEADVAFIHVGCTEIGARCGLESFCLEVDRLGAALNGGMPQVDGTALALGEFFGRNVGGGKRNGEGRQKNGCEESFEHGSFILP